jgi:hypothetical protein
LLFLVEGNLADFRLLPFRFAGDDKTESINGPRLQEAVDSAALKLCRRSVLVKLPFAGDAAMAGTRRGFTELKAEGRGQ